MKSRRKQTTGRADLSSVTCSTNHLIRLTAGNNGDKYDDDDDDSCLSRVKYVIRMDNMCYSMSHATLASWLSFQARIVWTSEEHERHRTTLSAAALAFATADLLRT